MEPLAHKDFDYNLQLLANNKTRMKVLDFQKMARMPNYRHQQAKGPKVHSHQMIHSKVYLSYLLQGLSNR